MSAYAESAMKDLVGKTINRIDINKSKTIIRFKIKDSEDFLYFKAEGDCCSESWFEHINITSAYKLEGEGEGLEVVEIKDIELGQVMPSRQESDEIYGIEIKCKCSRYDYNEKISIELRNSSNGYYGGSIKESSADDIKEYGYNAEFSQIEDSF